MIVKGVYGAAPSSWDVEVVCPGPVWLLVPGPLCDLASRGVPVVVVSSVCPGAVLSLFVSWLVV